MRKIIVVNNPQDWKLEVDGVEVVAVKEYLGNPIFASASNLRVFNLCNDYRYQTRGYYVSLLAEARGHKPLPDIKNILDLRHTLVRVVSEDIDELIQKSFKHIKSAEFTLSVYFGENIAKQYTKLSNELFRLFQAPMIRAKFSFSKKWTLQSIKIIPMKEIPEDHLPYVKAFAQDYFSRKFYNKPRKKKFLYDLAILVDDKDEAPPSSPAAIEKFVEAGEAIGLSVEVIKASDFHRLPAFDALFIRQNTHVENDAYRFARRAQADGLALVDYPEIILKCSNKVFITELLQLHNIPTPKTLIVHHDSKKEIIAKIGFPCVLKLPDSTFSMGVQKAKDEAELTEKMQHLLKSSDLILAQEYMYTEYDWRVGILDGEAMFVCKYYMAKGHWQIYNWKADDQDDILGNFDCLAVEDAPKEVVNTALKAALLVSKKGLFGVDLKYIDGKAYIIEINDNPNIDFGIEDQLLKDKLYLKIMQAFKQRIEKKLGLHALPVKDATTAQQP